MRTELSAKSDARTLHIAIPLYETLQHFVTHASHAAALQDVPWTHRSLRALLLMLLLLLPGLSLHIPEHHWGCAAHIRRHWRCLAIRPKHERRGAVSAGHAHCVRLLQNNLRGGRQHRLHERLLVLDGLLHLLLLLQPKLARGGHPWGQRGGVGCRCVDCVDTGCGGFGEFWDTGY